MTQPTRRLFVSVDPPATAVEELAAVVRELEVSRANKPGASTRVTPPGRWHVTLAFLGDVPADRVDAAAEALERVAALARAGAPGQAGPPGQPDAQSRARGLGGSDGLRLAGAGGPDQPAGPFTVRFAGGGTFGRGRFTILWARLAGDVNTLRVLSKAVRRELRRGRLPFDDKPFRPHLTLARPGDRISREAIAQDIARLDRYEGTAWRVDDLHLVEIDFVTHPGGPHYTRLHTVRFGP
jgi:2'-5' RNA ligase